MKKIGSTLVGLALLTIFSSNCNSQQKAPGTPAAAPAAPAATTTPAAPAPAATSAAPAGLKAVVKFSGTPPAAMKLNRQSDPVCAKVAKNDETVVVNSNGTLKNAVVRVTAGATAPSAPPATPVTVTQHECMYAPRVVAGMTGQALEIVNGDPVLHNIHAYSGTTTTFNQAQMQKSAPIKKTIGDGVTKLKCDVHPWMTGYTVGNANPYICVTGNDGSCTLGSLPAGTYTVEAWHEKYGTKTAQVTVGTTPGSVEFSFSAQ